VAQSEYSAPPYTTLDARLARRFIFGEKNAEIALVATNLGPRHQEITDRSEQFLHGSDPVNRTSRAIWLTLSLGERQP
jgi:iron complex outermembrane receptor protein